METGKQTPAIFNGGVSEAQVEAWKQQHRKSFAVEVQDGDEVHIGYFKRPTFETIKAVTKVAKTDEVEAGKVMFNNCWLGGSEELRTDALLFMAVQTQLGQVLNGFRGLIKNL
ncbi:MAG: hypothetical protein HDS66_07240 [Bacteroidales bacterium]|nr:hypothetical protein [Bacteroidales bacterium]